MNIATKKLIEVMKSNPMNEGRARLYGRLDIINEMIEFFENEGNDLMFTGDCNSCPSYLVKKFRKLRKEQKMIRAALCLEDGK